MSSSIERLVDDYDRGRLSRRTLVAFLTSIAACAGAQAGAQTPPGESKPSATSSDGPTFQAVGLNHIALQVRDVGRSRAFYVRHLGLQVSSESPSICFLDCGPDFVALFRHDQPGLHHYCYSIDDYAVQQVAEVLRENDLDPRVRGRRVYFDDPDGIEVQLAGRNR